MRPRTETGALSRPGRADAAGVGSGADLALLVLVGLAATWLVARVLRVAVDALYAGRDLVGGTENAALR